MYIVDACVYVKIFLDEKYRTESIDFFEYCFKNEIQIYLPDLFRYELYHVILKNNKNISLVQNILETNLLWGFEIFIPSKNNWDKAISMCQTWNDKIWYPAIYDSIYHAYAIENDLTFITSDHRHIAKTQHLWNILHIKDWKA